MFRDFNEILNNAEKKGGKAKKQLNEFRDMVNDCVVYDLGFSGVKLTWCNR